MTDEKSRDGDGGLTLFEKSYADFVREHETAQHELTKDILAAQHEYRMSEADCSSPDDASAAADRYVDAVRSAWRGAQKASKAAHDNFTGKFANAWKRTAREDLDPNGLIAVANGLAAVAQQSAATIGNLDVFSATGVMPPEEVLSPGGDRGVPGKAG